MFSSMFGVVLIFLKDFGCKIKVFSKVLGVWCCIDVFLRL